MLLRAHEHHVLHKVGHTQRIVRIAPRADLTTRCYKLQQPCICAT